MFMQILSRDLFFLVKIDDKTLDSIKHQPDTYYNLTQLTKNTVFLNILFK